MDLNSDLGEGFGVWRLGDDTAMLALVTSANVACGFHAGDATTMRRVCAHAAGHGVAVGAQVSYRDLAGFGRRRIEYDLPELRDEVIYQIAALDGFCRMYGDRVRYVKPHGALYHAASTDARQASAIVDAIADYDRSLPVLCLPGSALAHAGTRAGLRVVAEGFVDRAYRPDGALVPRTQPGAVLTDAHAVVAQALRLARFGEVVAVDGSVVRQPVASLCVHGDTAGAVSLARLVRAGLDDAGVAVRAFAPSPPACAPSPPA